jgi:glycosyltransferase involved in cell wall biosynthesis
MISCIVLTKNNGLTIARTLQSLSWCDEIICIDDFSGDNTALIAKKQKAHVFQRYLNDDFAQQRNFGMKKAHGQWILFVDSDEIVSETLQKEILQKISNSYCHSRESGNLSLKYWIPAQGRNDINGFYIKRTDVFLGRGLRYGETANVRLLRLARKDAGKWIRPIHEFWDVKGRMETLTNPLVHTAHQNVAQFIADINRYTSINAQYLYKNGERSDVFAIIAYPTGKFIQNYFVRLGFLDGTAGFIMAVMMSFHSFLTRAKLYVFNHAI